jgi:hypothetical protein
LRQDAASLTVIGRRLLLSVPVQSGDSGRHQETGMEPEIAISNVVQVSQRRWAYDVTFTFGVHSFTVRGFILTGPGEYGGFFVHSPSFKLHDGTWREVVTTPVETKAAIRRVVMQAVGVGL